MANDLERNLSLGVAGLQEHSLNYAEGKLREVLARDANHPAGLHFLGVTSCMLGRTDEGISMLRHAVAVEPGRILGWLDLAVALRDAGRAAEASSAYGRSIKLVAAKTEAPAFAPFHELTFGGPFSYSSVIEMVPVPSKPEMVPPLENLAFSIERSEYRFKFFDYMYRAKLRYGGERPPHRALFELIDAQRTRYADFLDEIAQFEADFAEIVLQAATTDSVPFWLNTWLPPLDAMALCTMLCRHKPKRLIEIGSGMSTKFARHVIAKHGLDTRLVSIDPAPRNEIDGLVDECVRNCLEDVDQQLFDQLEAGDFLCFDGSHRVFQNSDVTVFFLEILPTLKPGVVVHIHDIYLPYDYPAGHMPRLWNEQYLFATALLYGQGAFELLFPSWFVTCDADLSARVNALLRKGPLAEVSLHGASFWMRIPAMASPPLRRARVSKEAAQVAT
jgi:Methyltransferase domain